MDVNQHILIVTALEPKDEIEEKLWKQYSKVQELINGQSERERADSLNKYIAKGTEFHADVQLGLLHSILLSSSTAQASSYLADLLLCTRDGFRSAATKLSQLVYEKWSKFTDKCRTQTLWLFRQMIGKQLGQTEEVCKCLLRQITVGDVGTKNIWLIESLLGVFTDSWSWLTSNGSLVCLCVLKYLRVLVDHCDPQLENLRNKEADFCAQLLKEKFTECMAIGRDLVRLLQTVVRMPQIADVWNTIATNPTALCPKFTGIQQLVSIHTPKRFLSSLLTPDMETKLNYFMHKVKFNKTQKRYQEWFLKKYLNSPESQTLRYDLIRYICVCVHPSNEMLQSDIVPRYAVIGWLLATCSSNVVAANSKLSLFFDWLFFDPEKDNIMNIEPGILVMHHSLRHPLTHVTATLLDFLCKIGNHFYPPLAHVSKAGINSSLQIILKKGVLPNLSHLFDHARLDKELRAQLRESFPGFSTAQVNRKEDESLVSTGPLPRSPAPEPSPMETAMENHSDGDQGSFSDEEDLPPPNQSAFKPIDPPSLGVTLGVSAISLSPLPPLPGPTLEEITPLLDQVEITYRLLLVQIFKESEEEIRCEAVNDLIQKITKTASFGAEDVGQLAAALVASLRIELKPLVEKEKDANARARSVRDPLYTMFRVLCETTEDEPGRDLLLGLLQAMYHCQPAVGYLLLYFLCVGTVKDPDMQTYRHFHSDSGELIDSLTRDLELCGDNDFEVFGFILVRVLQTFTEETRGHHDLVRLVLSTVHVEQLQELGESVLQGELVLFTSDQVLDLVTASLAWESMEQVFLWQLLLAHKTPAERLLPLLPKLDRSAHSEASWNLTLMLQMEGPSFEYMRMVLCTSPNESSMTRMKYWATEHEEQFCDTLARHMTKATSTTKRKQRNTAKKDTPVLENILAHLKNIQESCKNISFLANETLQPALVHAAAGCTEAQRERYNDLFALVEDTEEGVPTKRSLRQTAARRANNASPQTPPSIVGNKKKFSGSSASDSEEEDMRPKPKRRRKGLPAYNVDDSE